MTNRWYILLCILIVSLSSALAVPIDRPLIVGHGASASGTDIRFGESVMVVSLSVERGGNVFYPLHDIESVELSDSMMKWDVTGIQHNFLASDVLVFDVYSPGTVLLDGDVITLVSGGHRVSIDMSYVEDTCWRSGSGFSCLDEISSSWVPHRVTIRYSPTGSWSGFPARIDPVITVMKTSEVEALDATFVTAQSNVFTSPTDGLNIFVATSEHLSTDASFRNSIRWRADGVLPGAYRETNSYPRELLPNSGYESYALLYHQEISDGDILFEYQHRDLDPAPATVRTSKDMGIVSMFYANPLQYDVYMTHVSTPVSITGLTYTELANLTIFTNETAEYLVIGYTQTDDANVGRRYYTRLRIGSDELNTTRIPFLGSEDYGVMLWDVVNITADTFVPVTMSMARDTAGPSFDTFPTMIAAMRLTDRFNYDFHEKNGSEAVVNTSYEIYDSGVFQYDGPATVLFEVFMEQNHTAAQQDSGWGEVRLLIDGIEACRNSYGTQSGTGPNGIPESHPYHCIIEDNETGIEVDAYDVQFRKSPGVANPYDYLMTSSRILVIEQADLVSEPPAPDVPASIGEVADAITSFTTLAYLILGGLLCVVVIIIARASRVLGLIYASYGPPILWIIAYMSLTSGMLRLIGVAAMVLVIAIGYFTQGER